MSSPGYRRRKRDLTLPFVLAILLLFALSVDEMFVHLKLALQTGGGVAGLFDLPDLRATVRSPRPRHCRSSHSRVPADPSWPLCPGEPDPAGERTFTFNPSPSPGESLSGVEALAALERQQWEELRAARGWDKVAGPGERWLPVAPMPSNPSRYFPELRHPTLSSGVRLTTSPDDPHWVDPPPREEAPAYTREEPRPLAAPMPARGIASLMPPPAPARAPAPAPAINPDDARAPWPTYAPGAQETEAPRLHFHAEPKVTAAKAERLIEVCGRMVAESRAAAAAAECAPKQEKPKEVDEGGTETLILP